MAYEGRQSLKPKRTLQECVIGDEAPDPQRETSCSLKHVYIYTCAFGV